MRRINYAIHLSEEFQPFRTDLPCDFVHRRKAAPGNLAFQSFPGGAVHKDFEVEGLHRFENEGGSLGAARCEDFAV